MSNGGSYYVEDGEVKGPLDKSLIHKVLQLYLVL